MDGKQGQAAGGRSCPHLDARIAEFDDVAK